MAGNRGGNQSNDCAPRGRDRKRSLVKLSLFDYEFPERLIAKQPHEPRDESRLLVINRARNELQHQRFLDLPSRLHPGDVLVINDTKVFPARLLGKKQSGGAVEVLLVRRHGLAEFTAMTRSSKGVRAGQRIEVATGFEVEIGQLEQPGFVRVTLHADDVEKSLHEFGHIPLPPYMQRQDTVDDRTMYQTMFANQEGSAAAPTAGLHFTPRVMAMIEARGVAVARITLHVGPGTFMPVREDASEDVRKHVMHAETYEVSEQAAATISAAKGRVIAVGTTSVRTLESVAQKHGRVCADSGETSLYILPGYEFAAVDAMVTNFHQPKSTLMMLVSAFAGIDLMRQAYQTAIAQEYRLFSYGDACFIE